jgi:phage N-6-adenine-methyltransferase
LKLETRTSPDVMRCGGDKWVWESASALQDQADLEERSAIDEVVTKPHVANNTGDNEWYTPAHIIEAARSVMGGIDLDPASSEVANATVQATTYYTEMDNGLAQDWSGRVWMNPPYASDLIGGFCAKLVRHYRDGEIDQSIVLVNNATETGWFCELISVASAIVFPKGRIRFLKGDGVLGAPLQGQAIIYIGNQSQLFYDQFVNYGWGAIL